MTKTAKPRLGAGDITIMLGEGDDREEHRLVPSLRAARTICQRYESLIQAASRAAMADIEAVIVIIIAGLGLTPRGAKEMEIEEKIFATGLTDATGGLAQRCAEYCGVLMGGGRPHELSGENPEASHDAADPRTSSKHTKGSSTG